MCCGNAVGCSSAQGASFRNRSICESKSAVVLNLSGICFARICMLFCMHVATSRLTNDVMTECFDVGLLMMASRDSLPVCIVSLLFCRSFAHRLALSAHARMPG